MLTLRRILLWFHPTKNLSFSLNTNFLSWWEQILTLSLLVVVFNPIAFNICLQILAKLLFSILWYILLSLHIFWKIWKVHLLMVLRVVTIFILIPHFLLRIIIIISFINVIRCKTEVLRLVHSVSININNYNFIKSVCWYRIVTEILFK